MLRECKVMAVTHQLGLNLAPCLVQASQKQRAFLEAWHPQCNSKSIKLTVVINNNSSNQAKQEDHSSNKLKEHPWGLQWEIQWDSSQERTLARLSHSSMISLTEIELAN